MEVKSLIAYSSPTAQQAAIIRMVLDSLASPHTRRAYSRALLDFFRWHAAQGRPSLTKAVVQGYAAALTAPESDKRERFFKHPVASTVVFFRVVFNPNTSKPRLAATLDAQEREHEIANSFSLMSVCRRQNEADILTKASGQRVLCHRKPMLSRVSDS